MSASDDTLPKLWDDRSLRPYLGEVRRRHGVVETLALPSMRDLPPVPIETLFVQPLLAETPVSPDHDPEHWPPGKSLFEELQARPQLVVLGDPGSGKTTLANWLAWRISAGLVAPLPAVLEDRVPLPCVLREMPGEVFTAELPELAERIANRLLDNGASEALTASLRARVAAGAYVLILDGADEIPIAHRKVVARWVREAAGQGACVFATSRVVGYDDWPVDREPPARQRFPFYEGGTAMTGIAAAFMREPIDGLKRVHAPALPAAAAGTAWTAPTVLKARQPAGFPAPEFEGAAPWAQRRHLMPFDPTRVAAFAANWYRQRCGSEIEAQEKTKDLLAAIGKSETTRRLARTPNLLGLMAIVHRERMHLPDGKAALYDDIANAYLNTIDRQRKIAPDDALARHEWKERAGWLAYVAFQMQLRRQGEDRENTNAPETMEGSVLAAESDVEHWLADAMRASGVDNPEAVAPVFLSWVARRSGLLLPRGEGQFAFVHLSFQEYFCARYLNDQFMSRAFVRDTLPEDAPVTRERFARWGDNSVWRETLVFLFERLSAELDSGWVEELTETVFPSRGENADFLGEEAALAARIIANPHVRLPAERKERLADRCGWYASVVAGENVLAPLVDAGYAAVTRGPLQFAPMFPLPEQVIRKLDSLEQIRDQRQLRLLIAIGFDDFAPLAELGNLRWLTLSAKPLTDVSPLAGLRNLRSLDISNTQVADISPLVKLTELGSLNLSNTQVADISPLAKLTELGSLNLSNTQVADISPLAKLTELGSLNLSNTQVANISPLAKLTELRWLNLSNTQVADISPLAKLTELGWLNLSDTRVKDVSPLALAGPDKLGILYIAKTQVVDISPLAKLDKLMLLDLSDTAVSNVASLATLGKLRNLRLAGTQISDVTPLAHIHGLAYLDLDRTHVTDISPLATLTNLKIRGFTPPTEDKQPQ